MFRAVLLAAAALALVSCEASAPQPSAYNQRGYYPGYPAPSTDGNYSPYSRPGGIRQPPPWW